MEQMLVCWFVCKIISVFESHLHSSGPLGCSKPYRYGRYWAHVRHSELQVKQPAFPTVCREAGWVVSEAAFPTILLCGEGHLWLPPCAPHHTFPSWAGTSMASKVFRCCPALQVPPRAGSARWGGGSAMQGGLHLLVFLPPGCQGRQKSTRSSSVPDCKRQGSLEAWVAFSWWRPYSSLFQTCRHIWQAALTSGS